jgi:hypothetical protein
MFLVSLPYPVCVSLCASVANPNPFLCAPCASVVNPFSFRQILIQHRHDRLRKGRQPLLGLAKKPKLFTTETRSSQRKDVSGVISRIYPVKFEEHFTGASAPSVRCRVSASQKL